MCHLVKHQHIMDLVCVKEVCMVNDWGIVSASLVLFIFLSVIATAVHFHMAEKGIRRG